MAQRNAPEGDNFTAINGEDDGFNTVESESQIIFNEIGDEFIGTYLGMDRVGAKEMWQAHFENGKETFFTNAGYDLRKKLEKVPVKAITRVRYVDNLDTGQETPMRVYDVAYK